MRGALREGVDSIRLLSLAALPAGCSSHGAEPVYPTFEPNDEPVLIVVRTKQNHELHLGSPHRAELANRVPSPVWTCDGCMVGTASAVEALASYGLWDN